MTEKLTREQVLANRMTWINFLSNKNLKKGTGLLDDGKGARCCLGHGCFALKIPRQKEYVGFSYGSHHEKSYAPSEFMELVGLWASNGRTDNGEFVGGCRAESLAEANDNTDLRPWQIAEYLLEVVEGGHGTPFEPLTNYPEA